MIAALLFVIRCLTTEVREKNLENSAWFGRTAFTVYTVAPRPANNRRREPPRTPRFDR